MMKAILLCGLFLSLAACSSTVIVRKDTCKEIYGGVLLECEKVTK